MNRVVQHIKSWGLIRSTKTGWARRGYRVKKNPKTTKWSSVWNGMYYNNFTTYHIDDCDPIRGYLASERRAKFLDCLEDGENA